MEEIKRSPNFLSEEVTEMATQQTQLLVLLTEVHELCLTIRDRDGKIVELEKCVDSLEQQARMNDLVIIGLEMKHLTYKRAVSGGNDKRERERERESLQQQVISFFKLQNYKTNIEVCYALPLKERKIKPTIVLKMVSLKYKIDLMRQARSLRGAGVYLNDHLTKKNAEIARQARL
ncbi:hypothetical protein LDENG_00147870 [Lucifuga dentata]|nr:hypothetical protein LDENG_00147870 [Lucifuga dentata]